GSEKSGIDFQMRPTAITQVRGVIAPGSADWQGASLGVMLSPLDNSSQNTGSFFDPAKGTFEFRQVFPGSYNLVAWTNGGEDKRIGGWQRIDVAKQPVSIALQLKSGVNIDGRVEIESSQSTAQRTPVEHIRVMLNNGDMPGGPPSAAQ